MGDKVRNVVQLYKEVMIITGKLTVQNLPKVEELMSYIAHCFIKHKKYLLHLE